MNCYTTIAIIVQSQWLKLAAILLDLKHICGCCDAMQCSAFKVRRVHAVAVGLTRARMYGPTRAWTPRWVSRGKLVHHIKDDWTYKPFCQSQATTQLQLSTGRRMAEARWYILVGCRKFDANMLCFFELKAGSLWMISATPEKRILHQCRIFWFDSHIHP